MSTYPNYTLTQLAELILQFETKEGLSPAALANLKEFASSALENASQQPLALDAATARANFPTLDKALRGKWVALATPRK